MAKRGQVVEPTLELIEKTELEPGYVLDCGNQGCPYRRTYGRLKHRHYRYGDYEFAVRAEEKIETYTGPLFKWLDSEGRSTIGTHKWDLPTEAGPGAWAEPDSKLLATCDHGLHALLPGQQGFVGTRLFLAEAKGPVMFTYGKVVTMSLRLVREVDLLTDITPEVERQHWLQTVDQLTTGTYGYSPQVTKRHRHLIKSTRKATLAAIRREAKPFIAEYQRLRNEMLKFETSVERWTRLSGKKPTTNQDWDQWRDFKRERDKIGRKLSQLDRIFHSVSVRPTWQTIPLDAIENPDLKLYRSEPPKWQD